MGTITSGTGLISGLDIQGLITKLMAIEAKPRDDLKTRIDNITKEQTALMGIQARVMAIQIAAANFNKQSVFQQKKVNSTDEDVLTATTTSTTPNGTYRFLVNRLASNHHFVSRGYSSLRSSILNPGVSTSDISFEIGSGQLAQPTSLDFINGQTGFQRGAISITDRAGHTAQIDLSTALTVQDVLDTINANTTVNVKASVSGDHFVLTDNTGATTGNLIVNEVAGGATAAGLGLLGNVAASTITGGNINYLSADARLKDLNDGNGIRGLGYGDDLVFKADGNALLTVDLRNKLSEIVGLPEQSNTLQSLNGGAGVRLGKFSITDQNGRKLEIDLNEFVAQYGPRATLGQLKQFMQDKVTALNTASPSSAPMNLTIAFGGLDHFVITDASTPVANTDPNNKDRISHFIIKDLDGGSAAADLGIVDDVAGSTISGEQIWHMESIGDVLNAVNNHYANDGSIKLALDQATNALQLAYTGAGSLTVDASATADDLGLTNTTGLTGTFTGRRLIAGLNSVLLRSLNGGSGDTLNKRVLGGETLLLKDRASSTATTVDLTGVFTTQDLIERINASGTAIKASINQAGNGILLTDTSTGSANMQVSGTLADKLNLAVDAAANTRNSDNLQLQYVSGATQLADLRQGQGIRLGKINIKDGAGLIKTIDLATDNIKTVQDVIDAFAASGTTVRARVNDAGDGLLLYDTAGTKIFSIEEKGGSTAHDLRILGSAQQDASGNYTLDGSYEFKMNLGGGDSIEDIVTRINDADLGLKASIINAGTANNPSYRISFTSEVSGRAGAVYLDAGETNLSVQTLTEAQDAIVLFGGDASEGASPLLIHSSTNSIKDVIKGTTLELKSASDTPVELSISEDLDNIVTQIKSFVEAYNKAVDDIETAGKFDAKTLEKGILFANSALDSTRSTLTSIIQRAFPGSSLTRLSQVGIKFSPLGAETAADASGKNTTYAVATAPKLEFDETKFRDAYAADSDGVTDLFTKKDVGIGDYIAKRLDDLAGSSGSTMKHATDAMQNQQKMFNDRITYLDEMLASKETRLYNQFYAMEQALASMQSQQTALNSLSGLASSMKTSTSS